MPFSPVRRTAQTLLDAPFEALIALVYALSGASALTVPNAPSGAVAAAWPTWLIHAWGGYLLGGGLLVLAGLFTRSWPARIRVGYSLELAGMSLLAPATAVYAAVVVWSDFGSRGIYAAGVGAAFALACLVRALAIRSILRILERVPTDG